jgi:hypothetical protein
MKPPNGPSDQSNQVAGTPGQQWQYVPDEDPKKKHHWEQNVAGFVEVRGVQVGKCPKNVTMQQAQQLLNSGVEWAPMGWRKPYPKRIYNILNGVVYRATPTIPGQSYHGFPEHREDLPPEMKQPLRILARQLGCLEEVEKWLKG